MISLDQIGKGMPLAVDFLIVLVAFTGQYHHIVGACAGDQLGDGGTAAGNEGGLGYVFEACTDIVEDLARVLAARVVIGDQHAVSQTFNNLGHQRALAAITITAAAEQAQ